jgi:Pyruvate/2-oxoacid:ferredoxin oxidoreductase gamma subunit
MTAFLRENVKNAAVIPAGTIKEKYAKMLNAAMLGAAAEGGVFPFGIDVLLETISEMPRYREENIEAFELGRELYRDQH